MDKKVVHYIKWKYQRIIVGMPALVMPVDHYNDELVSNTSYVSTSKVISHNPETGEFETQNSIYKVYT